MAKISFDLEDGSPVQQFDVALPLAAPVVPDVQGVSLADLQKAEADAQAAAVAAATAVIDTTADVAADLPVVEPVVEAPVIPTE